MSPDFGLAIAPTYRDSALAGVSGRALQLFVRLASHAAHRPHTAQIGGSVTISLQPGQVPASWSTMASWLRCGRRQAGAALDELRAIGAITVEPVLRPATGKPRTVSDRNRGRYQSGTVRTGGNAPEQRCVVSLITLHGVKFAPRRNGVESTPSNGVKRELNRDLRQNNARAESAALANRWYEAEGR